MSASTRFAKDSSAGKWGAGGRLQKEEEGRQVRHPRAKQASERDLQKAGRREGCDLGTDNVIVLSPVRVRCFKPTLGSHRSL